MADRGSSGNAASMGASTWSLKAKEVAMWFGSDRRSAAGASAPDFPRLPCPARAAVQGLELLGPHRALVQP